MAVRPIDGDISTHALLAEGDPEQPGDADALKFQPTPSLRRATIPLLLAVHVKLPISTHALLAEGDGKLEQ